VEGGRANKEEHNSEEQSSPSVPFIGKGVAKARRGVVFLNILLIQSTPYVFCYVLYILIYANSFLLYYKKNKSLTGSRGYL
jgi:hypothetical protein